MKRNAKRDAANKLRKTDEVKFNESFFCQRCQGTKNVSALYL